MKQNYVATNLEQNFTDNEKALARENIGAFYYNGKLLKDYHDPESEWSYFTNLSSNIDTYQKIFTFNSNIQDYFFKSTADYRYTNFHCQFCCAINNAGAGTLIRWDIVDQNDNVVGTGQYDWCPGNSVSYHAININTIFSPAMVTAKGATYGIGVARWDGNAWGASDMYKLCGAYADPAVWIKKGVVTEE